MNFSRVKRKGKILALLTVLALVLLLKSPAISSTSNGAANDGIGTFIWSRTYGGEENDVGWNCIQTADGGFIITGYTESYPSGDENIYVVKVDSNGFLEWNRSYGSQEFDEIGTDIVECDAGNNYTLLCRTYYRDDIEWPSYPSVMKIDKQGNVKWKQDYYLNNSKLVDLVTVDGGILAVGWNRYTPSRYDNIFWLVKLDSEGKRCGTEHMDLQASRHSELA